MRVHISCRILALLISILMLASALPAQEALPAVLDPQLETQLTSAAGRLHGVLGYAISDLATGETFLRLPDTVFPPASSIKLTILLELMRQAQEGKLSLGENHTLRRRMIDLEDSKHGNENVSNPPRC